jgi:glycerol-3-phosphate dehydrogenase
LTNDSRLTPRTCGAEAGATVLNYAEVVELRREGAEVAVDGRVVSVSARAVVNASSVVDRVRRLEDPAAPARCG